MIAVLIYHLFIIYMREKEVAYLRKSVKLLKNNDKKQLFFDFIAKT